MTEQATDQSDDDDTCPVSLGFGAGPGGMAHNVCGRRRPCPDHDQNEHLVPVITDRGLQHMPPLASYRDLAKVKVFESPTAEEPCIWLGVLHPESGELEEAVQLPLDAAHQLGEQIFWLVRHHCQVADVEGHITYGRRYTAPEEPS